MSLAFLIAQLLWESKEEVVELILLIRRRDGSISVVPVLDEADEKFRENIRKIREWKREN